MDLTVLWLSLRSVTSPRSGGAERTIREIGSRLAAHGTRVVVVSGRDRDESPHGQVAGIEIHRMGSIAAPHLLYGTVMRQLGHVDVVVEDLAHVVPWLPRFSRLVPRTGFFRHLHARTLKGQTPPGVSNFLTIVERSYPLYSSHVPYVVESEQSKHDLCALGIPRSHIAMIPPGVDSSRFIPGIKTDYPLFVYFAGLKPYKRPQDAILAFQRVSQALPKARMIMFGEGPMLGTVKALANRLELVGKVEFPGKVPSEALRMSLGRAWVNVHCSVAEGFGYSILEASSAGVPTIAYSVPGVTETVRPGINGRLVPDKDIASLATAMMEFAGGGFDLSESARRWALRFDWNTSAQAWSDHLRAVSDGAVEVLGPTS